MVEIVTKCEVCGKEFVKYIKDYSLRRETFPDICYGCSLQSITGGQAPEEGDFNTARVSSGEMSEEERRLLQEDLRSVDAAACAPDPDDDDQLSYDERDYDDE